MKTIVFLLEEPSARVLIEGLLPRLFEPDSVHAVFMVFEGKQDLEKKLARRVEGYLDPNAHFVVLRDQDSGDCVAVKKSLQRILSKTGRKKTLVRIACRELEAWVLGDWAAVAAEFDQPRVKDFGKKAKFRDPDQIVKPVNELRRHLGDYQKVDGARRMGLRLDPSTNSSGSLRTFCDGLKKVCNVSSESR